ncbi:OLC1v1029010C2 [Oldenlandia corymbosa var. corymbosa]|uniref:OLC1v1029010C2 n=1 Tax=Oldenlandia corymbosa var. corymbosa TaxID=529605 RepID=A0AAV1CD21_OLDCO|nr:OLC1v1029010C2 [Oldenlandia corymbosa var. corymbosa]
MASFSSLTRPLSEFSLISQRLSDQSTNSLGFVNAPSDTTHGLWYFQPGIVKMRSKSSLYFKNSYKTEASTKTNSGIPYEVPILSCSEAIERLSKNRETYKSKEQFLSMYSSVFGGITTDPSAMLIPMDDHMVHRGHGVFDTAAIMDGYLYELDQHLDRFLKSATMAKIKPPFERETIRKILIQTVSASKCRKGSLRYWLSAGPGDFQLSPSGCHQSALYAIVIQNQSPPDYSGIKVVTSSLPIKPPQFAVMKSVNYLPNALSKMEAEEKGAYASIWLDFDGFVAEGPNMNVAFVTKEKELLTPEFDKILSGCTVKRVLALAESLVVNGMLTGIRVDKVTIEEGKAAEEMMLIGSGVLVRSVVEWDEQQIGDAIPSSRIL